MKLKGTTIGEVYGPAMEIKDQAEADDYFEQLVQQSMEQHGKTREEAVAMNRSNLGYYAGYYDNETRERVERLFKCAHPIFGSIAVKGPPTPEQAFKMGQEMGEKVKREKEGE